ncbi:MAG: aldo/keto reductase [Desulfobacterales bacterium]|nr:MAG: aldo/keto reductase [Desulfobacterales bacterium]
MQYRKLGKTDVALSIFGMGGHEYLADGRSRGFNENFDLAVTPNHIFVGFGQKTRQNVLKIAFDSGINFFDVTQDSEKEALGRNLKEITPPYEIYIQTRPEGMVYTYDKYNQKMADLGLLRAEVQRILRLLQRERLDFLNIAFMKSALDNDPRYLDKIGSNIAALKKEGLIRFACADTFSGEYTYLQQIAAGCFDAVYLNFNFADHGASLKVLPTAQEHDLGVITREAFMKGQLFKMGAECGVTDRSRLAEIGIKWNLSHPGVTNVIVGTNNPDHLTSNLKVLDNLELTDEDHRVIDLIKTSGTYQAYEKRKTEEFFASK